MSIEIDPAEVVPEGTDSAVVAALSLVEGYGRDMSTLKLKAAKLEAELAEMQAREERAALLAEGGEATGVEIYEEARAARVAAETALDRARTALRGAKTAYHAARLDHHKLNHGRVVSRFQRLTNHRAKLAAELQIAAESYERALSAFEAISVKTANAFAAAGGRAFPCHLLDRSGLDEITPFHRKPPRPNDTAVKELALGLKGGLMEIVAQSNQAILNVVSAAPVFGDEA